MKFCLHFFASIFIFGIIANLSCKKETSCEGCATKNNKPPIAVAGPDQVITLPADSVLLDGKQSSDPDGIISSYLWTKISGPASFNIVKPADSITKLKTLVAGTYQFELKVTDAGGLFSKDTMQVIVNATSTNPCAANRPIINAQLVPFGILSQGGNHVAVVTAGNKIVFAGGWNMSSTPTTGDATSRVDIYDIVTHNWSTAELSVARIGMAVAVSGNKIFFAGGYDTDGAAFVWKYNNVDIYDASTNTWSVDSLSSARSNVVGAAEGGKVFFAGGGWPLSNVVDVYDLVTNSWSALALSEAREIMSGVAANNRIYFAGGQHFNSSNRIDVYDNATASWSVSSLIEPKSGMASIVFGNKIYWAGGITNFEPASSQLSNVVEIKDLVTNTSSQACLFQPNSHFSAVSKNNKIIFFTGTGAIKNKFDIYDPATNIWSIGVLNENITGAIISVNNVIYVVGGNRIWKLEF